MAKTSELDKKIFDAYKQSDGYLALSKRFNIPRSTIRSIIKKYETHCVQNKLKTGRKWSIYERMEREIDISKNSLILNKSLILKKLQSILFIVIDLKKKN